MIDPESIEEGEEVDYNISGIDLAQEYYDNGFWEVPTAADLGSSQARERWLDQIVAALYDSPESFIQPSDIAAYRKLYEPEQCKIIYRAFGRELRRLAPKVEG